MPDVPNTAAQVVLHAIHVREHMHTPRVSFEEHSVMHLALNLRHDHADHSHHRTTDRSDRSSHHHAPS